MLGSNVKDSLTYFAFYRCGKAATVFFIITKISKTMATKKTIKAVIRLFDASIYIKAIYIKELSNYSYLSCNLKLTNRGQGIVFNYENRGLYIAPIHVTASQAYSIHRFLISNDFKELIFDRLIKFEQSPLTAIFYFEKQQLCFSSLEVINDKFFIPKRSKR